MEKCRRKKKIIIWTVIFRQLLTFLWEFFFTLIGFKLRNNFIRIIWFDNLEILFPRSRPGGSSSWTPFNFRACSAGYLTHKKTIRGKRKGPFYSSAIFFLDHFFPRPFLTSAIFSWYCVQEGHFQFFKDRN